MATADRQQEIYDALLDQLRLLCGRPGIKGAYLMDDDGNMLAGAGTRPDGRRTRLPEGCREAIDSGRKVVNGSAPDGFCGHFLQTPGFRCHVLDLGHRVRLLSLCGSDLNPGLVYRYAEPVAGAIGRLLKRLLSGDDGPGESPSPATDIDPDRGPPSDPIWK